MSPRANCRPLLLAVLAPLTAALVACPAKDKASGGAAVNVEEVKAVLLERERKLHAYRIEGTVTEAEQVASFRFAYRTPNRMLAEVRGEGTRTFAFDGERLMELVPGESRAQHFELNGKPEEVSMRLHQIFGSFVPEGFRAPVLEYGSAKARRVSHPRGPQAVELTTEVADPSGLVRAVYVLRWPGGDLLERRLSHGGMQMVQEVTREHCDERLKVCVPSRLEQRVNDAPGAVVDLSTVELNAPLPRDAFTPEVPDGWTVERLSLFPQEG